MNAAWSIHPKERWSSQCDSTISWICMVPSTITLVFYIQLSPYSKSHLKKWPIQMMHCSTNPSYEQYLATFLESTRSIHLCWSILTKSRIRGPKIVQLARSFSTIDKNWWKPNDRTWTFSSKWRVHYSNVMHKIHDSMHFWRSINRNWNAAVKHYKI